VSPAKIATSAAATAARAPSCPAGARLGRHVGGGHSGSGAYDRPVLRLATPADAAALAGAEKAAATAAFAHVFPPERFPYPEADVLVRWQLELDRDDLVTVVDEREGAVAGYAASAYEWLEHLGVIPQLWGTGLADHLHGVALSDIAARGHDHALLWVLEDNDRARRFYARRGWRPTGRRSTAEFPPHPPEIQLRRALT
jgi:GNAT superfamily N-acetyltransferase